jgi:hypothetical protein
MIEMKLCLILFSTIIAIKSSYACDLNSFTALITVNSQNWSSDDQNTLIDALCSVQSFAPNTKVAEIDINDTLMGYEYRHRLTLTPRFRPATSEPNFRQSLEKTIPVWTHEYGHAILRDRVLSLRPEWLNLMLKNHEYQFINSEYLSCISNQPKCTNIRELISRLMNFWTSNEEKQAVSDFVEIYTVYDEFYADVISLFQSNNPQSVFEALTFPGMNHYDLVKAQKRQFNYAHDLTDEINGQYHGVLAYARSWLWKEIIQERTYLTIVEKMQILTTLEKTILQEVEIRFENREVKLTEAEINLRFIHSFNRYY